MALEYDFQENRFSAWDYVVFAVVLALSLVIGLYHGCTGNKQSSTAEFLMAGRSMSVLPVALSLLASFLSAITLLGTPSEIVIYGTQYWMICVSYCLVIPIAAYIFIPVFYRLELTSVFEVIRCLTLKSLSLRPHSGPDLQECLDCSASTNLTAPKIRRKKKYFAAYGHFTYVITLHYIEVIFSGLSKNHTPLKGV